MSDDFAPKVLKIERKTGIAGQYGYAVTVDYSAEHGGVTDLEFIGNDYSERVYMLVHGFQIVVERSDLDGVKLTPDYVRRFFS